jgi:glycerol-3-phosphate acyltransferase PlsY
MPAFVPPVIAVMASYILGSIPAAYLAGKWKGVDLRRQGSGNLGATNVFRVLGAKVGTVVFLFDLAKGALPVLLFPQWVSGRLPPLAVAMSCGAAAVLGHVRPVFLRFGKGGGGKGVATAAGVFLGLAPLPTLAAILTFVGVLLVSGYVSLGSLVAALVLPVVLLATRGVSTLFVASVLVAGFVFWTHRANIRRLRRGEEHRFGRKVAH